MFKRLMAVISLVVILTLVLSACSGFGGSSLKVGMVTDSGTIDDKSFNQGTWEGVEKATKEFSLDDKYLKPAGTTKADYVKEIGNLYDAGYKMIVCPGFKFENAVYDTQTKYSDAKFVIIDGSPNDGNGNAKVGDNTVSIFFAEHQSGFIAGVATSLELKEGDLGFIGGQAFPAVQKFNWGFQQGVKYANENLGTKMTIKKENVIYQGTFTDVAAGQQLAAQMFDRGVKAVFCAAGGVGAGAINEAKTRQKSGKTNWVIGVDVDQYAEGIYDGDKSAVLTSAMKKIDTATYNMIKDEKDGKFQGGKTLTFDATNDGIGIPEKNPNLSEDTMTKVNDVLAKVKSGDIQVSDKQGDLIK